MDPGMDFLENPTDVLSMASLIMLVVLCALQSLELTRTVVEQANTVVANAYNYSDVVLYDQHFGAPSMDMEGVNHAATFLDDDLLFWVAPRSTTWFSCFLLREYDDEKWVQMFRITKRAVMSLANVLQPSIPKRDINYRHAIPVIVQLACTLFKLGHGASLLVCSEMFAVRRSTVSEMLRDVVCAINVALRSEMSWPSGDRLLSTAAEFYQLCGLPGVVGAIDGTQISIRKPKFEGSMDYYNYFKVKGYSMSCQAVVDSSNRFLDLYVGMPGSTHDSRTLRRSTLYYKAQRNVLWDAQASFRGFTPYFLGDSQYPLLPWLMVPHRQRGELSAADALFNEKMSQGRRVVENAFAMLKQSFKELQGKSELNVTFLPDVVICCALLHNVLLQRSNEDVERVIEALRTESGPPAQEADGNAGRHAGVRISAEQMCRPVGVRKRRDLGLYLAAQRNVVPE